jgi:DNA mismatch endonuclease (patch repair protein)
VLLAYGRTGSRVMVDNLTPRQRSRCMARIRSKNTRPEIIVRQLAHQLGFRFRLHIGDLPGKPDLVFPRHKKVILVHGCFWHKHRCAFGRVVPSTNTTYWEEKRKGNVERDRLSKRKLRSLGWSVLTVWECQTRNRDVLAARIAGFLCSRRES